MSVPAFIDITEEDQVQGGPGATELGGGDLRPKFLGRFQVLCVSRRLTGPTGFIQFSSQGEERGFRPEYLQNISTAHTGAQLSKESEDSVHNISQSIHLTHILELNPQGGSSLQYLQNISSPHIQEPSYQEVERGSSLEYRLNISTHTGAQPSERREFNPEYLPKHLNTYWSSALREGSVSKTVLPHVCFWFSRLVTIQQMFGKKGHNQWSD